MAEVTNAVTIGSLASILPELILLFGGLLILVLDTAFSDERNSGSGYMSISILFLIVALAGAVLQMGMDPHIVLSTIQIDSFGTFLKITILVIMALVAIAGGGYLNKRIAGPGEFWTLYLFVTVAMMLAVSAVNLLLIFLTVEFLSITSYLLVGFFRDDKRSTEAGVKYFLYGSVASSVMLYGMSLLYGASGSLNLSEIAAAFEANPDLSFLALPATILALVGLGFKTSLAPFFQWAPDTYEGAPTPVTAYLSTASKAVGFAVMTRIFIVALGGFRSEWVPILAGISILTMTAGNLMALRQNSVKRMLAYSSIAQAGYILMGLVAVVSTQQVDVNNLFMVVMAVEEETGTADISGFTDLIKRAPFLAVAMFIFLLSLTGIPATGGFIGKFYVFGAAVQHRYFWLAAIAMINAGIAGYYYLNVVRVMFFGTDESDEAEAETEEESVSNAMPVGIAVQIAVFLCVIGTFWLGLYPPSIIDWANDASRQLLALNF